MGDTGTPQTEKLLPKNDVPACDDSEDEQLLEDERIIIKAITRAVKSASNLAGLLPSGTVLIFQIFSPILSNGGHCNGGIEKIMTIALLACCGLLCFLVSFTDTYRSPSDRKLYYGIATFQGLWIPQLQKAPKDASSYKLQFVDFVHAFLSVLVFGASTLFTQNIKSCFYPLLPNDLQNSIPMVVGFIISLIFIVFPSKRRGFDYPVEGFAALYNSNI